MYLYRETLILFCRGIYYILCVNVFFVTSCLYCTFICNTFVSVLEGMYVCMYVCNPVANLLFQNPSLQVKLVEKMMTVPNQIWDSIIAKAAEDTGVLQDESVIRELGHILKINVRGCSSIGHPFVVQVTCHMSCTLSVSLLSDLLTH